MPLRSLPGAGQAADDRMEALLSRGKELLARPASHVLSMVQVYGEAHEAAFQVEVSRVLPDAVSRRPGNGKHEVRVCHAALAILTAEAGRSSATGELFSVLKNGEGDAKAVGLESLPGPLHVSGHCGAPSPGTATPTHRIDPNSSSGCLAVAGMEARWSSCGDPQ